MLWLRIYKYVYIFMYYRSCWKLWKFLSAHSTCMNDGVFCPFCCLFFLLFPWLWFWGQHALFILLEIWLCINLSGDLTLPKQFYGKKRNASLCLYNFSCVNQCIDLNASLTLLWIPLVHKVWLVNYSSRNISCFHVMQQ